MEVYKDKAEKWRWRRIASNGNIVADSGQGYSTKQSAITAAERECPRCPIEVID